MYEENEHCVCVCKREDEENEHCVCVCKREKEGGGFK